MCVILSVWFVVLVSLSFGWCCRPFTFFLPEKTKLTSSAQLLVCPAILPRFLAIICTTVCLEFLATTQANSPRQTSLNGCSACRKHLFCINNGRAASGAASLRTYVPGAPTIFDNQVFFTGLHSRQPLETSRAQHTALFADTDLLGPRHGPQVDGLDKLVPELHLDTKENQHFHREHLNLTLERSAITQLSRSTSIWPPCAQV